MRGLCMNQIRVIWGYMVGKGYVDVHAKQSEPRREMEDASTQLNMR